MIKNSAKIQPFLTINLQKLKLTLMLVHFETKFSKSMLFLSISAKYFPFVVYYTSTKHLSSFSATINLFYFYFYTKAAVTKIKAYFTC